MYTLLLRIIRGYACWMLVFLLNRILFTGYNHQVVQEAGWGIMPAFIYGMRIDMAMAAYLMVIPTLLYIAFALSPERSWRVIHHIYWILLLAIVAVICTVDLQLFNEWGSKINAQALAYIRYPKEMMASAGSSPIGLLLLLLLVQAVGSWLIYRWLVKRKLETYQPLPSLAMKIAVPAQALFLIAVSVIAMRGGFQLAPLNQSFVYYSAHSGANQAAVNTVWNLMYYLSNSGNQVNLEKYTLLRDSEADSLFKNLYHIEHPSPVQVLNSTRPNIVLVLLESFTADALQSMQGKNLAPNLDAIASRGILFEHIYASGDRTDKGLVAVLSGFPSQPTASIITEPDKLSQLAYLPAILKNTGYHTSFIYGGESEFANMKAYLFQSGFEQVTDKTGFHAEDMNSKWGAHDEVVLDRVIGSCNEAQQPFFTAVLTLSSHEPFEVPGRPKPHTRDEKILFENAVSYTDSCIGDFMRKAEKQPWYKNTLFVFVADHGHRLIGGYNKNFVPGKFRIPLIMAGGALKPGYQGVRWPVIGSQTDIAATLLNQEDISAQGFMFSRNLLDTATSGFAFYAYNDGLGWITPGKEFCLDYVSRQIIHKSGVNNDSLYQHNLLNAKAYMQVLMKQYTGISSPGKRR